ncbi:dienelactone hydrolase [Caulobacter rhizosphaerae]|uniref:Dienelactone hydrolase n=1 Tax=Caulobacter rhizosphaerae TaxID=2010972 RepID=A0ABU1N083_9CAUL|nr:dienelactone hydrolase family protein [Caulobacter rhizosphaerae]MDR6531827.1 dienelactone hydrolase [Caulobacter rhizosphaerae]
MRIVFLLLALLGAPSMSTAQSNFSRHNPPGPNAVGLRIVEQYDFSRGYRGETDVETGKPIAGERARPVQTLVWYPAAKGSGQGLTVGDYVKLGVTADDFDHPPAERATMQAKFVAAQVAMLSPERAKAELAAPMLARRDATPASGKFPVVIYAPSFNAEAYENADLCEYLASQGYLVIASPSFGQASRGMTTDLEGVEAQVGDIEFLIGYAHGLPQADMSRLAVAGYSWGGLANAMAAAKDSRIRALVTLDGSVRYWPNIVKQSQYLTPARVTAPMLYIAAAPKSVEDTAADVNGDQSFLAKMKYADLYKVTMYPYVHANFSAMFGQRLLPDSRYGAYDKDELSVANGWVETYVRRFLDAYLKGDAASRTFLDTPVAKTGAPRHLLAADVTKSTGAPPTRAAFAAELNRAGFDKALATYQAFKSRDPDFAIDETELNRWGYQRLAAGDTSMAAGVLKLAADLHPDSWNAFDSLGEAYAANGEKALAIAAYRRSLVLNPGNGNGAAQLKALGAAP